ncbi:hypothetical protein P7C71_g2968, partial [Lecanoromycetidae sp. Uapishka_2]
MASLAKLYTDFSDNHIAKHTQNDTLPKISRPWVERTLLEHIHDDLKIPTNYKICWMQNISASKMFDPLWLSYRKRLNLSIDQTVCYRADDDLLEIVEIELDSNSTPNSPTSATIPPTRDDRSQSRAISVASNNDLDDEVNGNTEAINPITLSPLQAASHDLSIIHEEPEEVSSSSSSSDSGDDDGEIVDEKGDVIPKKDKSYQAQEIRKLERKMAKKAANVANLRALAQERAVQRATSVAEDEDSDTQPSLLTTTRATKPATRPPPTKTVGRSAITKAKKPAATIPPAKVRAMAASRSRGTTPADNRSRATTPNVVTRSRAATPAVEEKAAASAEETSKTKKRKLERELFGDSESEEEPLAKKAKSNGKEREWAAGRGKGPAARGGKKVAK